MSAGTPSDPGASSGDRDLRLAESVLGTLDPAERALVERELATDPAARAARDAWERRLAPLALTAPEIAPGPDVWPAIARALARAPGAPTAANDDAIGPLRRSLRRWRLATGTAAALAAGLALFIALGPSRPTGADGRYVAVVSRGGEAPALLVNVDTRAGTARVRPVEAQAPAGRSLELWYVGAGQAPKTLGLVGSGTRGLSLDGLTTPAAADALANGTFAVSVEPEGGSPTGQPTGPVVYSGRLIRD